MDISPLGGLNSAGITGIPAYASNSVPSPSTATGLAGSQDFQVQLSDLGQLTNALALFQDSIRTLAQFGALGDTGTNQLSADPLANFATGFNQLQSVFSNLGSGLQSDSDLQGLQSDIYGAVFSYTHIEGSFVSLSLGPDGTLTMDAVAFESTMIDTGDGGLSSGLGSLADQLGSLLQGYSGPGAAGLAGSQGASTAATGSQDLVEMAATLEKMMESMQAFMQLMFQMLLGGGQSGGFNPAELLAIESLGQDNSGQNADR